MNAGVRRRRDGTTHPGAPATSPHAPPRPVSTEHPAIDDRLAAFMLAQPVFFVGTAPAGGEGHVNVVDRVSDSCGYAVPRMALEGMGPAEAAAANVNRVPTQLGMNASGNRSASACWARQPVQWAGTR